MDKPKRMSVRISEADDALLAAYATQVGTTRAAAAESLLHKALALQDEKKGIAEVKQRLDGLEACLERIEHQTYQVSKASSDVLCSQASTLGLVAWILPSLCGAYQKPPRLVAYLSHVSPAKIMSVARLLGQGLLDNSWSLRKALKDLPDKAGLDTHAIAGKTRAEWRESCSGSFSQDGTIYQVDNSKVLKKEKPHGKKH